MNCGHCVLQSNVYSYLYQIAHLGDDDDEPEFSSAMPLEEGDTFFFAPRALKNLVMVDELHSYAPILGKFIRHLRLYLSTPLRHADVNSLCDSRCQKKTIFLVKGKINALDIGSLNRNTISYGVPRRSNNFYYRFSLNTFV